MRMKKKWQAADSLPAAIVFTMVLSKSGGEWIG